MSNDKYKQPLFTIMMCTYNSAATMEHAIESVLKQNYKNWEMLILDNGSKDSTVELLRKFEEKDGRIQCIFRKQNVGWAKGISICLEHAKGEYMMFLGADDYLSTCEVLGKVAIEIEKHAPQIVWTGYHAAVYENGKYEIAVTIKPEYKVYQNEDKLTQFYELMRTVYYNSVMHYIEIDFLKEIGVDFYSPFYRDCEGMTEAIAKASKMVVLDDASYVLTANTSQTAKKTDYDYSVARQWKSIMSVLPCAEADSRMTFIARRVLNNLVAMCQNILLGGPLRNHEMNDVEATLAERFLRAEELFSADEMGEMICYANDIECVEALIGAAGVNYWLCKKNPVLITHIMQQSRWLAEFVDIVMLPDSKGEIQWKKFFTSDECHKLQVLFNRENNVYKWALELLLLPDVKFENLAEKRFLENLV